MPELAVAAPLSAPWTASIVGASPAAQRKSTPALSSASDKSTSSVLS